MTSPLTPARIALTLLGAANAGAWAAEYATVISSTPVVASVPVPQRQCTEEQRVYPPRSTGAGALIGAIAGAAIGNNLGSGAGQAAATGLGMVAGSVIGDRIETQGTPAPMALVQRCHTVTRMEQRTVGYDVVYEYLGMQRTARLAQDPGERVAVATVPAGAAPAPAGPTAQASPPAFAEAGLVVYEAAQPPPQVVYMQPAYAPAPAYVYGWPYTAVGAALWVGPGWYGGYGGRIGYHRYYRR